MFFLPHWQKVKFTLLSEKHVLADLDPQRNKPLIDWILSLPLEFHGDSAFTSKLWSSHAQVPEVELLP